MRIWFFSSHAGVAPMCPAWQYPYHAFPYRASPQIDVEDLYGQTSLEPTNPNKAACQLMLWQMYTLDEWTWTKARVEWKGSALRCSPRQGGLSRQGRGLWRACCIWPCEDTA